MARRGFFAELQYQSRLAAREHERAQREAARNHAAAVREAERAKSAALRAKAQLSRAAEAERKRLEKEAREAHIAAMEAEACSRAPPTARADLLRLMVGTSSSRVM